MPLFQGRCVGIKLPSVARGVETSSYLTDSVPVCELHEEELAFASSLSPSHCSQFIGGRIALRRAMGPELARRVEPVLRGPRGAPVLALCGGSISHKEEVAVALVRLATDSSATEQDLTCPIGECVGIDVENLARYRRTDLLSKKVLTSQEEIRLGTLAEAGLTRDQEVLLSFSFKEAVYKAIDPFLQRRVGFNEVEVFVAGDGTCSAHICEPEKGQELELAGQWRRIGDYVVTTMLSSRKVALSGN